MNAFGRGVRIALAPLLLVTVIIRFILLMLPLMLVFMAADEKMSQVRYDLHRFINWPWKVGDFTEER